ncbi:uncharacterized protein LOC143450609 [Clavelina lepadiformis]|uniref:uncharacterized protein LOC143450609 n=1 Tax=Clavelina lepadiformis TaxID=159417 RepID=UPI004042381A
MSSTSSHIPNTTPSASKNLTTADWLTQSSTQILITAECPIWVYIVVAVSTVAVVLVSELVGVFLFISCKNYRQTKKNCKEEESVKIYSSESEQPKVCEKENEFSQIYDVVAEDSEGIQGKRFDNDKRSDPFPLVPDDYSSNDVRVKNVTQSRVSTKEPEYGLTTNVLYQSA